MIAPSRTTGRAAPAIARPATAVHRPTPLLGGQTPAGFMRRHWQREPLVVRAALPESACVFDRGRLFALAARDGVESRLVVRDGAHWSMRPGPITKRSLPKLSQPGWTLLVQGVDLHDAAVHRLLQRFRFIADARLDDAMVSFASDGGGVGPHVDSYDVFLIQLAGTRVWRIGRAGRAPRLRDDVPLKMLARFVPRREFRLDAGDLLYLPPGWGHDGIAAGACLTCSIGFRAPDSRTLAAELLARLGEVRGDEGNGAAASRPRPRYSDAAAQATTTPARIPPALQRFADAAVRAAIADRSAASRALGELLSEPKPGTWFDRRSDPRAGARIDGIALERKTRMLYDASHLYVNGEALRVAGGDATLLRRLADRRCLTASELARASARAIAQLDAWCDAGWCRRRGDGGDGGDDDYDDDDERS